MEILFFVAVVAAVVTTWYVFNKSIVVKKDQPKLCECAPVDDALKPFGVDDVVNVGILPIVVKKDPVVEEKLDEEYLRPKPKKKAKVVKKNG
jgi:hypothetical protein